MKITDYRPANTDKPVDIILRVPQDRRTLNQIDDLEIQTAAGAVPIGNFVKRVPARRVGLIHRVDGQRVDTVTANVAEGVQTAAVQQEITKQLAERRLQGPGHLEAHRRGRRAHQRPGLSGQGVRRGDLPDLRGAARPVQQAVERGAGAVGDRLVDDRRVHRPDRHRPGVRRGDDRRRHHRARRHRHQQQHRADRHLRPAAARGRAGRGGDPAGPAASARAR